jgi:hypothetical protein
MNKEVKKVKVFFDEVSHYQEMAKTVEIVEVYKAAKKELEAILESQITDYAAFKSDPLLYSIAQIKLKYPAAFNLNLGLEKTLAMLSISLSKLEQYDAILKTTPHKIDVCIKTGNCTPNDDKEPFCYYAESPAQIERLKFTTELSEMLERASLLTPYVRKANVTNGLTHLVYYNIQTDTLTPNHNYILQGIQ